MISTKTSRPVYRKYGGIQVNFSLKPPIRGQVDVRMESTALGQIIKVMGGRYVRVYNDGFSFRWYKTPCFTNGNARMLGASVAQLPQFKKHVIRYDYTHSGSGKPGHSGQLFYRIL